MTTMDVWFPRLKETKVEDGVVPRLRLVTFPNAGSSENVYTGPDKTAFGGEAGRRENLLIKWAKARGVEVYAAQPPGRDARLKEPALESCAAIAKEAFEVLKDALFSEPAAPWAAFAHSMGSWVAAEFVKLAPTPPTILVVSAFPSPTLAVAERPWTELGTLGDDEAFKAECREWNINELVFGESMWKTYEPLLRRDFKCFNDYPAWAAGESLGDVPVRAIRGTDDKRCTRELVARWAEVTSDFAELDAVDGHHLFPYDEAARYAWFRRVTEAIDEAQPRAVYECIGRKGAACRTGSELTTALVEPELQSGWIVEVADEKVNLKGTVRLHIVTYAKGVDAEATPIDAWASKKLFAYKGVAAKPAKKMPTQEGHEETKEELSPDPEASSFATGKLYEVVGKAGAMLRSGCELDTRDIDLTLPTGCECYVAQERPNANGALRARVLRYSDKAGPWREVDGWCTAKFLSPLSTTPEPLPAPGTMPFAALFKKPTGSDIVVLFPGQGAQKIGMADAYLDVPGVRDMFAKASQVFGEDILEIVRNGPVEKLNDTRFSQVCVFLTSLAAMKKVERDDPAVVAKASACAGFSLGEYTALAFAGVLDLPTALELLKVRGAAMGAACDASEVATGMMTVVGLEDPKLAELMAPYAEVSVANQLFPKGRVLSGPKDQLAKLEADVKGLQLPGTKTIVQPVSGAFHSKYMAPAAATLLTALQNATFAKPSRLVYSNVTAKPHDADPAAIKQKMFEQLTAGVLWEDTIRDMANRCPNTTNFYEPAPGKQLSSMMRRINPDNVSKMKNV